MTSSRVASGFSLIELLVAMLITMVISGAIYGLMAMGQGAFRREPALAERQANVRMALDLIARDVANAGSGMDAFAQAFSDGLNDPPAPDSVPSEIRAGERADMLEMVGVDAACPAVTSCANAPGNLELRERAPECLRPRADAPSFVYVAGRGGIGVSPGPGAGALPPGMLMASSLPASTGSCGPSMLLFDPARVGTTCVSGAFGLGTCESVARAQIVRYELAPDPETGVPALWRSAIGRRFTDGAAGARPRDGYVAASPWMIVAAGIEDLQVEYQTGAEFPAAPDTWRDTPGRVSCGTRCASPGAAEYDTLVRRVRVTLSARALGGNIGGETVGAVSRQRRGQMVLAVTPRASLVALKAGERWR